MVYLYLFLAFSQINKVQTKQYAVMQLYRDIVKVWHTYIHYCAHPEIVHIFILIILTFLLL